MQMMKGLVLAGLCSALILSCAPVNAGNISVTDDSGGGTLLMVTGNATGGMATGNSNQIDTFEVDGSAASIPTSVSIKITDVGAMTPGVGGSITATGTMTFGTGASEAIVSFSSGSGTVSDFSNKGAVTASFINLQGTITSVSSNAYPGYDFSPLLGFAVSVAITHTGPTDYAAVLGNTKGVAGNSGLGFQMSDASAPEPTSVALLGIGLTSLLVFRRFRTRTSIA